MNSSRNHQNNNNNQNAGKQTSARKNNRKDTTTRNLVQNPLQTTTKVTASEVNPRLQKLPEIPELLEELDELDELEEPSEMLVPNMVHVSEDWKESPELMQRNLKAAKVAAVKEAAKAAAKEAKSAAKTAAKEAKSNPVFAGANARKSRINQTKAPQSSKAFSCRGDLGKLAAQLRQEFVCMKFG